MIWPNTIPPLATGSFGIVWPTINTSPFKQMHYQNSSRVRNTLWSWWLTTWSRISWRWDFLQMCAKKWMNIIFVFKAWWLLLLLCKWLCGELMQAFDLSLQGGDLASDEQPCPAECPLLLQWMKTDHALVMLFNTGSLQVSFIQVIHSRLIICLFMPLFIWRMRNDQLI